MRIEFLTQDDPIYVFPFFDEFVRNYGVEFEITQISASRAMGKRRRWQMVKELTQLYGIVGVIRLVGGLIVSRILGYFPMKEGAAKYWTLPQLCRAYGISYQQVSNPNDSAFIESIRRRRPELLVSVACPYILKAPVLAVAPKGAINIHHAPLPRYKGMMPTFWQMFHGEKSVGLTIHYMVEKIDEGEALLRDEQNIDPDDTLHAIIQRSKRHGAHCMAKVLRQVAQGSAKPTAMDHSKGSYFTFPTAAEISEFRRRNLRPI
jgi:methionyl-tRNA formyltransferase